MALMGFREYSRHRKVALRSVQKAIEAGRIKVQGEGRERKIDSDQADRDWLANTDPAARSLLYSDGPNASGGAEAGTAAGAGGAMVPPAIDDEEDEPPAAAVSPEYRAARARREQIRVAKEEIELEQLRGTIVSLAEAELLIFTAFRSVRDAALQVAPRVKDRCAASSDPLEIEHIVEAELSAAFERFNPAAMLKPGSDDEEEEEGGAG